MQCKIVGDESIPRLVRGIKGTINDPDNLAAHLALISAAQDMLQPGGDLVSLSKAAIPTVGDQSASLSLSNAAKNLATALSELRAASTRAQETCQSLEIDGALNQLHLLQQELEDMRRAVATGNLIPMPGDTVGRHKQNRINQTRLFTVFIVNKDRKFCNMLLCVGGRSICSVGCLI